MESSVQGLEANTGIRIVAQSREQRIPHVSRSGVAFEDLDRFDTQSIVALVLCRRQHQVLDVPVAQAAGNHPAAGFIESDLDVSRRVRLHGPDRG